jgi:enoyl-CoA hydratase/carnithine racemase
VSTDLGTSAVGLFHSLASGAGPVGVTRTRERRQMDEVRLEREHNGAVAVLLLDRPAKRNAMTVQMYADISRLLRQIDADDRIRVGIVHGTSGTFSAGADLVDVHSGAVAGQTWHPPHADRFDAGLEVHTPLIAAVEGYCLAGGLELALVCDIRVAGVSAQFGTPEVKWNLLHGFGAQLLPGIVGRSNAMYLLLTGQFIDAREAWRTGLVQEVVPDGRALDRAKELASMIAANAPMATAMTKELVARGRDLGLQDGLRFYHALNSLVHASEDTAEGTGAFAEKRSPQFRDR